MPVIDQSTSRRNFLKYLAASPLLGAGGMAALAHESPSRFPDPMVWAPRDMGELIKSPKDAINVFDFEPVAYKNVPPAHFGYMASGIDDEVTLRANREAFNRLVLRPRRLVDVTKVDTSIELFGVKWDTPVIIAPTGGNRAFHDDGELAIRIVGQLGVEPLDTTAVLDDRVPVRPPHGEAVGVIVLERRGHFLQGGWSEDLASKQPLLPPPQVLSGGVECTRREGDAHVDVARIHGAVCAGRVARRAVEDDRRARVIS